MSGRPDRVRVPALVGLTVPDAQDAALDAGLLAVLAAPRAAGTATVIEQHPPAGRRVGRGQVVRIWARRDDDPEDPGGGGGRRPAPVGPRPLCPSGTKPRP